MGRSAEATSDELGATSVKSSVLLAALALRNGRRCHSAGRTGPEVLEQRSGPQRSNSASAGTERCVAEEQGAAAVEFALVLPLLLLLVFGMVDFARAYNVHISLSGAAREGARALALGTGDVETTTRNAAPTLPAEDISVLPEPNDCATSAGMPARVTASYEYHYLTPISGLLTLFGGSELTSPITISGIGVMRCGG